MKRDYLGALLLCLAAPACSHQGSAADQTARVAADQTAPYETPQAERASQVYSEQRLGIQPEAKGGDEMWSATSAESERMELPAPSEKRETASSSAEISAGRGSSSSAASSYGNPPGAHTQPGTTRAVEPSQGAQGDTLMKEARVTDEAPIGDNAHVRQGTSSSDRSTTQRIRRAIINDDSLSYTAKNIEVVTHNGNITLRGKVLSDRERWEIERITRGYAGSGKVDNDLDITSKPVSGTTY